MRISTAFGLAATLIVIGTPLGSIANAATPGVDQNPFVGSGNDPAQGRYYDASDKYLDWHTGLPFPGSPGMSGGGDGE